MALPNRLDALILFTWQFVNFFSAQMVFGIFANFTPRWRCQQPQNGSLTDFGKNCAVYAQCPDGALEFERSPFGSAAMEFEWICGTSGYVKALYSQVQFTGILLGTVFLSPLSDRFGRKTIGLSTFAAGLLALASSAFAPTSELLLLCRFVICFFIGSSKVVLATFTMEIIAPEKRIFLRTFCNWGMSRLILTTLCFLFPDWRTASISIAFACVPAMLLLTFLLPESPTWLHSKGRLEEMERSEQWLAQLAGHPHVPIPHAASAKRPKLIAIVRNRALFGRLLVLWMMWFCSALSSYSIDLNSSNLSGNLFLNQLLLAFPIIGSKVFLLLLDSKWPTFSRRTLHQGAQSVVCVSFSLLLVLVMLRYDGLLILFANLVGITFLEYTWDANYLSAVESMPTQMRATSLGSCSMVARFGALFSPALVFLNDLWSISAYLAVVSLGTANLFVSYFWLPETKGVDLDAVEVKEEEELDSVDEKEAIQFLPKKV